MLADITAIMVSRSKVIPEKMLHLFIEEKEFNQFLMKYFTTSQNVCAAESRLILMREFQGSLDNYLKSVQKEKKKLELITLVKSNEVHN